MKNKTKPDKNQRSIHDLLKIPPGEYSKTILGKDYNSKDLEPKDSVYPNSVHKPSKGI